MKFSQLKIGDRFRYQNAGYTKTGPLQAVADGSTNPQLIMRSAVVQTPVDDKESQPAGHSATMRLRQAIDVYHKECKAILESEVANAGADKFSRLDKLHQELLQILDTIDSPVHRKKTLR